MSQPKVTSFVHFYNNEETVAFVIADVTRRFLSYCKDNAVRFTHPILVNVEPSLFSNGQIRATARAWETK